MKKNYWTKLLLLGTLVVAGCYPQGPEFINDLDVVFTNHYSNYDFSSKSTYAIPDEIVKITGNAITGDPPKYVPDAVAGVMLSQIESNMNALGYTKVDIADSPDLLVAPAAIETTTITYWYDYWGYWWGGYYPGWGYPYYPGYTTSYSTGTLVITLIDPDKTAGDGNPIGQWVGALNGVLTGTYDAARVNKLIDQAFKQSPYLNTK